MQAGVNLAVAIDPSNTSCVYVTGDGIVGTPFTVAAFRVQGQTATSLTLGNSSNNSTAHSDSRALVVGAAGNLWMGSDGGIYMRSNPQSDNGAWTGFNTSSLQIGEPYAVAYDSLNKRFAVALQDAGVALQSAPVSPRWDALTGADGTQVVINSRFTDNTSAIYFTTQNHGQRQSDSIRCERQSDQPEYVGLRAGDADQLQLQWIVRRMQRPCA